MTNIISDYNTDLYRNAKRREISLCTYVQNILLISLKTHSPYFQYFDKKKDTKRVIENYDRC